MREIVGLVGTKIDLDVSIGAEQDISLATEPALAKKVSLLARPCSVFFRMQEPVAVYTKAEHPARSLQRFLQTMGLLTAGTFLRNPSGKSVSRKRQASEERYFTVWIISLFTLDTDDLM